MHRSENLRIHLVRFVCRSFGWLARKRVELIQRNSNAQRKQRKSALIMSAFSLCGVLLLSGAPLHAKDPVKETREASSLMSEAAKKLPPPSDPQFIPELMRYLDDLHRGDHSRSQIAMTVKSTHFTRKLVMDSWSLGSDYSLIRILEPKKELGTATLKVKDDLFTYLAKTGRTIKVSGAMMGGSWMGSHFTNDDLVRASRFSESFDSKLTFDGEVKGVGIYRFELIPKPDAPVVWGKIEVTVRKRDLQPLLQVYFDEDGKKMRAMMFSDFAKVGDRVLPKKMVVKPLDGSGESTTVEFRSIDFSVKLERDFFSLSRLKSL